MIKGRKGLGGIIHFLNKYKFSILCTIVFYMIARMLMGKHSNQHIFEIISFLLLFNTLAKAKRIISIPLAIIFTFLISFDAFFAIIYNEPMTFGILEAIEGTNSGEISSMSKYILPRAIPIFLVLLGLIFLSLKELKNSRINWKVSLILFVAFWSFFVLGGAYLKTQREVYTAKEFEEEPYFAIYFTTNRKFPLIYRNIIMYMAYQEQMKPLRDYAGTVRVIPKDIILDIDKLDEQPAKIYIVIGESATRGHHSLYGYSIPTTPFLDSLSVVNDSPMRHYDGISGAPYTTLTVQMLLSFAYPQSLDNVFIQKNLLELGKEAGYRVSWISSQGRIGKADTGVGLIASVSDELTYLERQPPEDLALIPELKEKLTSDAKQLFILHLEGSHMLYRERFDALDKQAIAGSGVGVEYDRTLHHTDRVLRNIYKTAEANGESYVILYISDHGEIIGKGHGFMNEGVEQFNIPFLSISNKQQQIDSIISKYIEPELNVINNTQVSNIVLELMGYSLTEDRVKKAVEAGKYVRHADSQVHLSKNLLK